MWEVPPGVPGAEDHDLVVVFVDDTGTEASRRRLDTVGVRAGCGCGWRGPTVYRPPTAIAPGEERAGNAVEVEERLERWRPELAAQWWREHLRAALPVLELAAAMPAVRLADPALADAVASAWVDGASWSAIGAAVGISRQGAHKRWRTAVSDAGGRRVMVPAPDGRPRRRELPPPGGWPGQPGWAHPAPELAPVHEPLAWGVTLSGRATRGVTGASAYVGPGCRCGWSGRSVPAPDVPRSRLPAALGELAVRVFAPAWHEHLHRAAPTLRITAALGPARVSPEELGRLVAEARARGATWADIGTVVGITTQGAWDRWRPDDPTRGPGRRATPQRRRTSVLRSRAGS